MCWEVVAWIAMIAIAPFTWLVDPVWPQTQPTANGTPRTLFVTRSLRHEQLLPFIQACRPDIVQIGNYGAMFHGYADHPKSTGWPMQLPVVGETQTLEFQRDLNARVRRLGLKVVGHFRLVKVMGHWKDQTGFCEYYDKHWPQDLLGAKPHPKLEELLQRSSDGTPIQTGRYNQSQLALCLSSPHTVAILKRMLKVAIDNGVDGVNTNFNYRFECACPYCQASFKRHLAERFTPAKLKAVLHIDNLETHPFEQLTGKIPGYPDSDATELDWEAAVWANSHFKKQFDEIFVRYGRSLKPDLMIAQWNHLGHVGLNDERNFLAIDRWGAGEDYFWYSGGASFVGKNLNLAVRKAGDAWLSCLYVRELSGGKPFVMGKYDRIRLAVSMAEGFATGGLGMGRYMRFEDPVGFEVLSKYIRFRHDHDDLFRGTSPTADVGLILPRQSVLQRHPASLDVFRELGQHLLERSVTLDVLADERISPERLAKYPSLVAPQTTVLSEHQRDALRNYIQRGGKLYLVGDFATEKIRGAVSFTADDLSDVAQKITDARARDGGVAIKAPWTVRAASYQRGDEILLHLVNYDRDEGRPGERSTGPADERPRIVRQEQMSVRWPLPSGREAKTIVSYSPDHSPQPIEFKRIESGVEFAPSEFKVYQILRITLKPNQRQPN